MVLGRSPARQLFDLRQHASQIGLDLARRRTEKIGEVDAAVAHLGLERDELAHHPRALDGCAERFPLQIIDSSGELRLFAGFQQRILAELTQIDFAARASARIFAFHFSWERRGQTRSLERRAFACESKRASAHVHSDGTRAAALRLMHTRWFRKSYDSEYERHTHPEHDDPIPE